MAKIDLSDVYIDISDLELDSNEFEDLIRENYENLEFSTVINLAMDYCSPVKFVSEMLESMTKDQVRQVISKFTNTGNSEYAILLEYIRKINPEWDWKTDNHYNFNLVTIDAIIKALVGKSNTIKPAEVIGYRSIPSE